MTLHILTAGTSVANTYKRIAPSEHLDSPEKFRRAIGEKIAVLRQNHSQDYLQMLSAETNGLSRADVLAGDEIILLTSETDAGRLCGDAVVSVVKSSFDGIKVSCRIVPGLQVDDPTRFRREGIPNLFRTLDDLTGDCSPDEVHLNVSGGFKGTVPFVVLYAMFNDMRVAYVFERTDTEIVLPGLPIEFDWSRYALVAEALLTVEEKTALSEHEILEMMPNENVTGRRAFRTLFEPTDGGQFTLSPLGHLVVGRLNSVIETTPVYLSPSASKTLVGLRGPQEKTITQMIGRLRNPLMRTLPHHADRLHSTDLLVLKRYTSSGPRVLYWAMSGTIYVAEIFTQHDAYDNFWKNDPKQIVDYPTSGFSEFPIGEIETVETGFLDELETLKLDALEEMDALQTQLAIVRESENAIKLELAKTRKEQKKSEQQVADRVRNAADQKWKGRLSMTESRLQRQVNEVIAENDAVTAEKRALEDRLAELEAQFKTPSVCDNDDSTADTSE